MPWTIWKRRIALLVLIAFVLGVPLTLMIRGDDDATDGPLALELRQSERNRGLKIDYRLPKGWKKEKVDGAIKLRSRDRSVLIGLGAPAGSRRRDQVLEDLVAAIRANYRKVQLAPGEGIVGGRKAKGALGSAINRKGSELRIALTTVKGKDRIYVIEMFTSQDAAPERLAEARAVLESLRLRG